MSMDAEEYRKEKERVLRESETGHMNRKDRRRHDRQERIHAKKSAGVRHIQPMPKSGNNRPRK